MIHADDYADAMSRIQRRLAGEKGLYPTEVRYLDLAGTPVPMEVSAAAIIFGGKPAVQFIARDIGERKRAQLEMEIIHKQLLNASRRAGMAEIATNVLHNVGNVLNSVNISTGLIVESVKKSRAPSLARVVDLIEEHTHDLGTFLTRDARGQQLPAYLARLSEHLLAEQAAIGSELDSLRRNIEHIKEIVAMQQSYARFGGVKEVINVVQLVEDSLRMNESALSHQGVEVIREFENVPAINVEKHKILQILVNLVRNAQHACNDSERADKRLTVRVALAPRARPRAGSPPAGVSRRAAGAAPEAESEAQSAGRVKISVGDNGIGIPPENLARIFSHGFTTRKGGHGFGLHSGALAAREMGGSLRVSSEGIGRGATFTLELPLLLPTGELP
jgi:signal transduction histidine kinase